MFLRVCRHGSDPVKPGMNPVKDPATEIKNPEIRSENPAGTRQNPVEPGKTPQDTVDFGIHIFRSLPGFAGWVRRCWATLGDFGLLFPT